MNFNCFPLLFNMFRVNSVYFTVDYTLGRKFNSLFHLTMAILPKIIANRLYFDAHNHFLQLALVFVLIVSRRRKKQQPSICLTDSEKRQKKNTWRCRIRTSSQVRCMLTVVEVYLMNFSLILIILPLNKTQYTQMQRRRRKILMKTNVFKQNQ